MDKKQIWSCLHRKEPRPGHIGSNSMIKELEGGGGIWPQFHMCNQTPAKARMQTMMENFNKNRWSYTLMAAPAAVSSWRTLIPSTSYRVNSDLIRKIAYMLKHPISNTGDTLGLGIISIFNASASTSLLIDCKFTHLHDFCYMNCQALFPKISNINW